MKNSPSNREPRSPSDRVHEDQNPTPQISEEVSVKVPEEVIDSSSETVRQSSKCSAPEGLTPLESEMLAALKGVVAVADRRTVEFDAARAAIAKAEGRS